MVEQGQGVGEGLVDETKNEDEHNIDSDTHPGPSKTTVITVAQIYDMTREKWEDDLQDFMGFRSNLTGPDPDKDEFDYKEYGPDNPAADPDEPEVEGLSMDRGGFDIMDGSNDPGPLPDIIVDEFGGITIPMEDRLNEYFGKRINKGGQLPIKIKNYLHVARNLRKVADALLESEEHKQLIFESETAFSKIKFPKLTQKKFMEPLGIKTKSTRSRISNRYIKTPNWGVLHLSQFFPGVEVDWGKILDYVREILEGESLKNPWSTKQIWKLVTNNFDLNYKNSRMFKKNLAQAGIPLRKPRKDIYTCTEKWKEKWDVWNVGSPDIRKIRLELQKEFKMFDDGQAEKCGKEPYIPFVEARIWAVLNKK